MPPHQTALARTDFPHALRFEGHAIVSADGMIAVADGTVPAALRNDIDWRQFQAALDGSVLVVLGRLGHRNHPNPGRRRLVFTGSVEGLAADPADANATLFNPAGATLAAALASFGIAGGTIAVTGGTRIFEYFLPLYDRFSLAEVQELGLPGGRPCFVDRHPRAALSAAGLLPRRFELIDPPAKVTLTSWQR